jgi:hypothetical protein
MGRLRSVALHNPVVAFPTVLIFLIAFFQQSEWRLVPLPRNSRFQSCQPDAAWRIATRSLAQSDTSGSQCSLSLTLLSNRRLWIVAQGRPAGVMPSILVA